MYENERFWNLKEDGCGRTRYIPEVERVSLAVELKVNQIYLKEWGNI